MSTIFLKPKFLGRPAEVALCAIVFVLCGTLGNVTVSAGSPWADSLWERYETSDRQSEADFLVGFDAVYAESLHNVRSARALNERLIEQLRASFDEGAERDRLDGLFSVFGRYLHVQCTSRPGQFPPLARNGPPGASPEFRLRHHLTCDVLSVVDPQFAADSGFHLGRQLELARSIDQPWYASQAAVKLYLRDAVLPESRYCQLLRDSLDQLQQDDEDAIPFTEMVRAFVDARQQSKLNSADTFRDLIRKATAAHNTSFTFMLYRYYFDWAQTTDEFPELIGDFDEWLVLVKAGGCPRDIGQVYARLANVYAFDSELQDHQRALEYANAAHQAWEGTAVVGSTQVRDIRRLIVHESAQIAGQQSGTADSDADKTGHPGRSTSQQALHSIVWFYLFTLTAVVLVIAGFILISRCATLSTKLQNQRELQSESQEQVETLEHDLSRITRMDSLGKVAGGVAHDFNNLLTGILSNSELAQMPNVSASERDQLLDGITRSASAAAELCHQILSYSASSPIEVSRFDVNAVINEMMPLLRSGLGKQMNVRFESDQDSVMFDGDRAGIQQIVLNLVTNAAEACREMSDRKVTVRTGLAVPEIRSGSKWFGRPLADSGPHSFLEVSDTGRGIDSDLIDQMFDPFVTRSVGGQGLGLAVVIGVVRKHQAAIQVDTAAARGTAVRVWFPDSPRSTCVADRSQLRGGGDQTTAAVSLPTKSG